VRGGMPGRQARELCPQLTFVSGHFKDYQRLGDAAIKVVNDFTPLVERMDMEEGELSVDFDGRDVTYGFGELDELVLAISVCQSQMLTIVLKHPQKIGNMILEK
jgi:DNA polymerase-4